MLVVHSSIPVNSLAEFVAYARKKEPIAYAHGRPGTPGHLCDGIFPSSGRLPGNTGALIAAIRNWRSISLPARSKFGF